MTRTGVPFEALSHQKCMDRLCELIDLPALRAEHAVLRQRGVYRGIGFASFVERTATNSADSAHIRKATAQDGITLTSIRRARSDALSGSPTRAREHTRSSPRSLPKAWASCPRPSASSRATARPRHMGPACALHAERRSAASWRCRLLANFEGRLVASRAILCRCLQTC